jgi:hypothetical protein
MRKEVERCRAAIDLALSGRRVALVSSGDAGIYGMAGLVFDICRERNLRVARPGMDSGDGADFYLELQDTGMPEAEGNTARGRHSGTARPWPRYPPSRGHDH